MRRDPRVRGLPSLEEARAERKRAIVLGRVRVRGMPPQFWLIAGTAIAAFGVLYWRLAQGQLESQKSAVMAKQRAIVQTLGAKILPFRDRVESWAQELSGQWRGDFVKPGVSLESVTKSPGVYLRLRVANAQGPASIRKAARQSLHDGFTSCFFVRANAADPTKGPACHSPAECSPGLLCNEWNVCAPPPVPYNMRLAYRTLRVLSTEWTDELHQTTNDLTVSAYDRDLDAVTKNDVPVAIDLLARAKYFTLVLDEDPAGGLAPQAADAGVSETDEERVQREPHAARVGIWELQGNTPVLRVRAEAAGRFVPVGDAVVKSTETIYAQQRQTNSCALALQVKDALAKGGPRSAPAAGQSAAPAQSAAP
jgi:hypothetical protein